MSRYTEFFFADHADIVQYETLEISHSDFSQTYYVVRNAIGGITATDEDSNSRSWVYVPMSIKPSGQSSDLDFGIEVVFGDLGSIIPTELTAVRAASGMDERPVVIYRTFASDTLTAPMLGPYTLEVRQMSLTQEGAAFKCVPPLANRTKTGVLYLPETFPTLRGFL